MTFLARLFPSLFRNKLAEYTQLRQTAEQLSRRIALRKSSHKEWKHLHAELCQVRSRMLEIEAARIIGRPWSARLSIAGKPVQLRVRGRGL